MNKKEKRNKVSGDIGEQALKEKQPCDYFNMYFASTLESKQLRKFNASASLT